MTETKAPFVLSAKKIISAVFVLLFVPTIVYSNSLKIVITPMSEPVCNSPLELKINVIDETGLPDISYKGKKKMMVSVKEIGGEEDNSYSIRNKKVKFRKGEGFLYLENSEQESLELEVGIKDAQKSALIKLDFIEKDIFPPEIEEFSVEGDGIILIKFNEALDEESAVDTDNYLTVTNMQESNPDSIEFHGDNVVLFFEESFQEEEEGVIVLNGIKDIHGNEIPSDTETPDFKGDCGCVD